MTEEIEKKSIVAKPDEIEKKTVSECCSGAGKVFLVSLLGGLIAGIMFYIFEQLSDEKKDYIKEQVSAALKSQVKKWASE